MTGPLWRQNQCLEIEIHGEGMCDVRQGHFFISLCQQHVYLSNWAPVMIYRDFSEGLTDQEGVGKYMGSANIRVNMAKRQVSFEEV